MRSALLFAVVCLLAVACGDDGLEGYTSDRSEVAENVTTTIDGSVAIPTTPDTTAVPESTTTTRAPQPAAEHGIDAAPGLGDAYFPALGNEGYDAISYDLRLDVDTTTDTVQGAMTMQARALLDLRSFSLDFVGMDVVEAVVDGIVVEYTHEDGELVLFASETIASGSTFEVDVTYEGTPTLVDSPAWRSGVGWIDAGPFSYVVSEPSGAHGFYPVNDHPSDKAIYRFEITAPSDDEVIANGLLTSRTELPDGTTTWVYEPRDPMASYLVTIAIGNFLLTESTSDSGLVLRDALAPPFAPLADTITQMHTEMIDHFEDLFGPYPFEAYGALVVDDDFGGALENQTLSVFSGSIMRGSIIEDVVAHELAHQWFGDAVTPVRWRDIWLNEGFATYAEWLWRDAKYPDFDIDAHARDLADRGRGLWGPPGDPGPGDLFASTVYIRGGLTLHALRLTVGDDAFFEILRTYVERNLHSTVGTEDFIAVSEEVSGMDLAALFEAWLYEGQTPELP